MVIRTIDLEFPRVTAPHSVPHTAFFHPPLDFVFNVRVGGQRCEWRRAWHDELGQHLPHQCMPAVCQARILYRCCHCFPRALALNHMIR